MAQHKWTPFHESAWADDMASELHRQSWWWGKLHWRCIECWEAVLVLWVQLWRVAPAFNPSVLPCPWTIQDQMQHGQNHIVESPGQEQERLCGVREATKAWSSHHRPKRWLANEAMQLTAVTCSHGLATPSTRVEVVVDAASYPSSIPANYSSEASFTISGIGQQHQVMFRDFLWLLCQRMEWAEVRWWHFWVTPIASDKYGVSSTAPSLLLQPQGLPPLEPEKLPYSY